MGLERGNEMEETRQNRRREPRFEIGGHAVLRAETGGEGYAATVLNVSGAGLFLRLDSHPFQVGDEVVCEIKLPERPEQPLASWGLGRVVRMDPTGVAIELDTATFALDQ
jgi:Tfp pilus assembly protein PilZ